MQTDLSQLYDEKEVSEIWGITRRRLQRLRSEGGGPDWIRLGRRSVRYRGLAIEEYLALRVQDGSEK